MKTKFYIFVSILLITTIISTNTIAQEFNSLQIKTIHEKADSILDAYRLYNTFTEDDKEISQKYINSFKKLFGDSKYQKNTKVFNDIEKTGYLEKKVSLAEYIKSIKVFYKEGGLGITIKDITYEKPVLIKPYENNIYIKPNKYKINVNLSKRVFGFFQNKTTYDETFEMIITITFNKRKNQFCDFIIQGVNSSETFLDGQSKESKYEAGFLFMPTVTRIDTKAKSGNNYISTQFKPGFQLNFNLSYYYFLYRDIKIGAGIGLGISKYKTELSVGSYQQAAFQTIDSDGDSYELIAKMNTGLKDMINLTYFDVSVHLLNFKNYKWLSNIKWFNGLEVSASLGFNFSFPMSKKAKISSEITTTGYYPEYHVELTEIDYYGFISKEPIDEEYDIKFSSINVSGFGKLGVSKPIINNLSINVGINGIYGLSNISGYDKENNYVVERKDNCPESKHNIFNSLMVRGSKTHTSMIGIYFGLSYKL